MPRHPALQSLAFLERTFVARDHRGERHVIATVGEALRFLVRLPDTFDGLHWPATGAVLCAAHRTNDTGFATAAFRYCLGAHGLLISNVDPA